MMQQRLNAGAPVKIRSEDSKALDDLLRSDGLEFQDSVNSEYKMLLVNPHSEIEEYVLQAAQDERVEFYGLHEEIFIIKVIKRSSGDMIDAVAIYNEPFPITADDTEFQAYYKKLSESRDLSGFEVFGHN